VIAFPIRHRCRTLRYQMPEQARGQCRRDVALTAMNRFDRMNEIDFADVLENVAPRPSSNCVGHQFGIIRCSQDDNFNLGVPLANGASYLYAVSTYFSRKDEDVERVTRRHFESVACGGPLSHDCKVW